VARDLIVNRALHQPSAYSNVYRINGKLVPNWGHTVVLGLLTWIVGPVHAEAVLLSLLIVIGFFSFSYAFKSIAPEASPWMPLTNFLVQTSFLWIGFDNFCLAFLLCPAVIGYYIRNIGRFTVRRACIVSVWVLGLFFIHLMGAVLAIMALSLTGLWVFIRERDARSFGLLAASLAPAVLLLLRFVRSANGSLQFDTDLSAAFTSFPMQVFTTGAGNSGAQVFLWPAVLGFTLLSIALMNRSEWQTPRGALAVAALLAFVLAMVMPDAGLGGSGAKARFAWAVFIAGGLAACSVIRVQKLSFVFSMYVAVFLASSLISTNEALAVWSPAVEDYLAIGKSIPHGANFVRIKYPLNRVPDRYRLRDIGRDLLVHTDAAVAAQCQCMDLSDYEAPTGTFPLIFKSSVRPEERRDLWAFESPSPTVGATLLALQKSLPVPIDFVILVADAASGHDAEKLREELGSTMRLVASSPADEPFVRLYASAPTP